MAFGKKKILRVEFVDTKGERLIGFDELSLKEIPVDFTEETWVEIDGDRWKVAKVQPATAKKALRSGTLTVHVDLVEKRTPEAEAPAVEVKEVPVYSYPSRADQMPRMSGKRQDLRLLEMGTWEWRDCELTNASNRSVAKEVFGKIEELIQLNSTVRDGKTFYTRQYDRYDFFAPLRGSKVTLEMIVTEYFPASKAIDGLTFMGSDQVADSTFVFSVPSGVVLYGQEFDEVVRYLGVHRPATLMATQLREDATILAEFMRKKALILVDWPKRQIVEADSDALLDYFLEGFAADAIADARETLAKTPSESVAPPTQVSAAIREEPVVAPIAAVVPIAPIAEANPSPIVADPTSVVEVPSPDSPIEISKVEEVVAPVEEAVLAVESVPVAQTTVILEKITETTTIIEEKTIEISVVSLPDSPELETQTPTEPPFQEAEVVETTVIEPIENEVTEPEIPETPPTYLEFSSPVEELEVHETSNLPEQTDSPEKEFKTEDPQ